MAEPRYRWVIVAAGAVMGCIALGAMFSLPVLLRPITTSTGWSTTGVSAAGPDSGPHRTPSPTSIALCTVCDI